MSFSVNLLIKIFGDSNLYFAGAPIDVRKKLIVYCLAETNNIIHLIQGLEHLDEYYDVENNKNDEAYKGIKTYIIENYDFIKLFWIKYVSEKLPCKSNKEMGLGEFKKLFYAIFGMYDYGAEEFISSYEKVNDKYKQEEDIFGETIACNDDIINIFNTKINGVTVKKFIQDSLILKNCENLKTINTYVRYQFIYKNTDHNVFKSAINMDQPVENIRNYDFKKSTVLINAVENKDIKIIKAIIDNGADVNLFVENNLNALMMAVKLNQKKVAKCLLKRGANPNLKNKYGETVLFKCGNYEIFQMLLKFGADINIKNNCNNTCLHYILRYDNDDIFKLTQLLIKNNIDINVQNNGGYTPLHIIIGSRKSIDNSKNNTGKLLLNTQIIQLLVDNSANIDLRNNEGISPLSLAKSYNFKNISKILTKNNKLITKKEINEKEINEKVETINLNIKCCQAITLSGNQCKNKTNDKYCHKHQQ